MTGSFPAPPPMGGPSYAGAPENHGKATAAMICGIVGIFIAGLILGIIAIVLGSQAQSEINGSPGRYRNLGQAKAGVILGVIDIVLWLIVILVIVNN